MNKRITLFRLHTAALFLPALLMTVQSCSKSEIASPTSPDLPLLTAVSSGTTLENNFGTLQVFTMAGDGNVGYVDGTKTQTRFNFPGAVATDASGNVFIADVANNRIRKMTATGVVTTFAGSGTAGYQDGAGTTAQFNSPSGVATDAAGNVYVADKNNHVIRKIAPDGTVSTLAGSVGLPGSTDGPGVSAQFNFPAGVAVNASGNVLVADSANHKIRTINPDGFVSSFAGNGTRGTADGPGSFSQFNGPTGVSADASGNVFVADAGNNKIRKIAGGLVSTLAGGGSTGDASGFADGSATDARFSHPTGVVADGAGNVFVADKSNHAIRQINASGMVSTLTGNGTAGFLDGAGSGARFNSPSGIAMDISGTLIIADQNNQRIREVGIIAMVSTFAGLVNNRGYLDGTLSTAKFTNPHGIAFDAAGNLYVADATNWRIRKITPAGIVSTLAGNGIQGHVDGPGSVAEFYNLMGLAVDAAGNVYVGDEASVRKITPSGVVSTLAGGTTQGFLDGPVSAALFYRVIGVAVDNAGNVYAADPHNYRIRKITPTGIVSTLAGNGTAGFINGPGSAAEFMDPDGITIDGSGNLYVADRYNQAIRKITPNGDVTTLAGGNPTPGGTDGTGATVQFNYPWAVSVDAFGNVYVADTFNQRIRKISPTGLVTTIAANTTGGDYRLGGFANGLAPFARFNAPIDLVVSASGNAVYVSDYGNSLIRKIQ